MDIRDVLKMVTVDCKDNGREFIVSDRLQVINDLLNQTDYHLIHKGKLCYIYAKQHVKNKSVILISSHVDCVYDRLFCKELADGRQFRGTFDNSVTNACLLYSMLQGSLNDNVIIAFTGDEEENSGGAYEVVRTLRQWNTHLALAMVLDATEEGWKEQYDFTIENDLGIDIYTGHRIMDLLGLHPHKFGFIHDSEPDESYDYDEEDIPCFSLCFPVCGDMHGEDGVLIRADALPYYCSALVELANMLAENSQIMEKTYYIEYEERGDNIKLRRIHFNENDCNEHYDYLSVKEKDGRLDLLSLIHGKKVEMIEDFGMMDGKGITVRELVIPSSITRLGKKNFSRWRGLEKVVLYCEGSAMREWNFAYCYNLRTVVCKNSSIYNYCKRLPLDRSALTYGCFDGCLDNIEFVLDVES